MFLSGEVRELHHDWRTNGKYLVHVLLLKELLHTNGYHTLFAVAAVIGHDNHLVRALAHLVFKDDEILRTSSHH